MPKRIALLSPYHGGSHEYWANGLMHHSGHEITLFALPARFWKWRMHGGAISLARRFLSHPGNFDVILATDMLDVTSFHSLTRAKSHITPTILYMHENQLTYPLPDDPNIGPMRRQLGERDLHYAFINLISMLAADLVMFNSRYHRDELLGALPKFINGFPEYRESTASEEIKKKSIVFPVSIGFSEANPVNPERNGTATPLILWNQRWEYDKNPKDFFDALYHLAERNIAFELAICGKNFRNEPHEFQRASDLLADRIIHYGYAKEEQYQQLLVKADIIVSTAHHEFLGIAVLEAMAYDTFPILPDRLSYPEILPDQYHGSCLYSSQEELLEKLQWALQNIDKLKHLRWSISQAMTSYHWSNIIPRFDALIDSISYNP